MDGIRRRLHRLTEHLHSSFTPHHVLNMILSMTFFVLKGVDPVCQLLMPERVECGLDMHEHQILVFLGFVIYWRNRKATSWLHYLSNVFLYARIANVALFFFLDPLMCAVYTAIMLVVAVLFPEPAYRGPDKTISYEPETLKDELAAKKKHAFLIKFHANWSPACRRVAPVFAKLSDRFTSDKLHFGALDVGRYEAQAEREYRVNASATSRQLPTLALFRNGKEVTRRPLVYKGRAQPYVYSEQNIITDFDLLNLNNEINSTTNQSQQPTETNKTK